MCTVALYSYIIMVLNEYVCVCVCVCVCGEREIVLTSAYSSFVQLYVNGS